MNEQNLIPGNKRSKSELREITRKGGLKSGESRRKKADVKKLVSIFLNEAPPEKAQKQLQALGYEGDDMNMLAAMVCSMGIKAVNGDQKAIEWCMRYNSQSPDEKRKAEELKIKKAELELKKAELELKKRELEMKAKAKDETESTPSIVEQIGELLNQNRLNKND